MRFISYTHIQYSMLLLHGSFSTVLNLLKVVLGILDAYPSSLVSENIRRLM